MSTFDFDEVVEHYHQALGEFVKGNPEPVKKMSSHREDVTLANPLGPPVRGWEQVAAAGERAASLSREGEIVGFDIVAKLLNLPTWCGESGSRPSLAEGRMSPQALCG